MIIRANEERKINEKCVGLPILESNSHDGYNMKFITMWTEWHKYVVNIVT